MGPALGPWPHPFVLRLHGRHRPHPCKCPWVRVGEPRVFSSAHSRGRIMKTFTAILRSAAVHVPPLHEQAQPPPMAADQVGGRDVPLYSADSQHRNPMLTAIVPF